MGKAELFEMGVQIREHQTEHVDRFATPESYQSKFKLGRDCLNRDHEV